MGAQEVWVVETNQEGCSGVPVCLDVFVEDDVWNIREQETPPNLVFPNPSSEVVNMTLPEANVYDRYRVLDAKGKVLAQGVVTDQALSFVVADWPSGLYVMALDQGTQLRFNVIH